MALREQIVEMGLVIGASIGAVVERVTGGVPGRREWTVRPVTRPTFIGA